MVFIYGYLERDNDKIFKFHINSSSSFETSLRLVSTPTNKCHPLKPRLKAPATLEEIRYL